MSWNVLKCLEHSPIESLEMSWNVLKCLEHSNTESLEMSWNVLKCLDNSYTECLEMSWNVLKCLDIVTLMYRSTRPTFSGDTSLGKNTNRTYKDSVVSACEEEGFHKKLWTPPTSGDVPPWVFSKAECIRADKRMKCIIGTSYIYLINQSLLYLNQSCAFRSCWNNAHPRCHEGWKGG